MHTVNRPSVSVSLAVFLLRLVWGIVFIVHGVQKLADINKAVDSFAHLGIPQPAIAAPALGLFEIIGGAILILGFSWVTRLLALMLAAEMIAILVKVRYSLGLVSGYELDVVLLTGLVAIALLGPGMLAVMREKSQTPRRVVHAAP